MFKAVKDFDKYRCIERMVCEYMQEEGDVASALLSGAAEAGALGGGGGGGSALGGLGSLLGGGSSSNVVDTR